MHFNSKLSLDLFFFTENCNEFHLLIECCIYRVDIQMKTTALFPIVFSLSYTFEKNSLSYS